MVTKYLIKSRSRQDIKYVREAVSRKEQLPQKKPAFGYFEYLLIDLDIEQIVFKRRIF
jgi:hypothetical protein